MLVSDPLWRGTGFNSRYIHQFFCAGVAQLDRAVVCGTKDYRFKSYRRYQIL